MLEKIVRYSLAWAFLLACVYMYGWLFYSIAWRIIH